MANLQIIGVPQSNFVWVVRMACAKKGVPYDLVPARPHSPEIDAVHPLGRIPGMRHGDLKLFESKAIATYIDRAFPGRKLFPTIRQRLGGSSNGCRSSIRRSTPSWCAATC